MAGQKNTKFVTEVRQAGSNVGGLFWQSKEPDTQGTYLENLAPNRFNTWVHFPPDLTEIALQACNEWGKFIMLVADPIRFPLPF